MLTAEMRRKEKKAGGWRQHIICDGYRRRQADDVCCPISNWEAGIGRDLSLPNGMRRRRTGTRYGMRAAVCGDFKRHEAVRGILRGKIRAAWGLTPGSGCSFFGCRKRRKVVWCNDQLPQQQTQGMDKKVYAHFRKNSTAEQESRNRSLTQSISWRR